MKYTFNPKPLTQQPNSFMRLLILIIGSLTIFPSLRVQAADRPNILYFYVDDMGWGSIGPNGQWDRREQGLASVRTPNIDELARNGMNFTRGYGCFVCSPARSSQQTGFHQGHTFADRNDPDNAKKAIRREDLTMGDVLAKAGYATGYWGKWGYGGSKDQVDPQVDNVQTLPTSHGYQHVLAELHHVRAHTFFQPTLWHAPAPTGAKGGLHLIANTLTDYTGKTYPQTPAFQSHTDYPQTAYCDDSYAMACLDFVRTQAKNYRDTGQPFFGLFAAQIPHAPFDEVAKLPNWNLAYADDKHFASLPKQSQQWAAMVTRIDAHFGNILAALEDPNGDGNKDDSVVEDTLVVFQSDNGGPTGTNNASFAANGNLSGNKGKIQEGGIRVPLVMSWPGMIQSNTSHDDPVDVTDLLPTFCELAGTKAPLGIDGVSIVTLLTGEGRERKRPFVIHEAGNGNSIIQGDFKLVAPKPVTKKKPKKASGKTPAKKPQLFNLTKDPEESNDISAAHPELVKELSQHLIDERVNEPKGFAVTYHRWTGKDDGDVMDPNNWSDYVYENGGITYTEVRGVPDSSAIVTIDSGSKVVMQEDMSLLALEISSAQLLAGQYHLNCRNELRISDGGTLNVQRNLSTMRWIDVQESGKLTAGGSITGDLYVDGNLEVTGPLSISGNLFLADTAKVLIKQGGKVTVTGNITFGGTISVPALKEDRQVISSEGKVRGKMKGKDVTIDHRSDGLFVSFPK